MFAKLVALALYARWRVEGEAFVPPYMDFQAAGGSASPGDLLATLDVDLRSAEVWDSAFAELERMVAAAESEVGAEA